jgi:hypothetical protein
MIASTTRKIAINNTNDVMGYVCQLHISVALVCLFGNASGQEFIFM